jgi:hypothetical protein
MVLFNRGEHVERRVDGFQRDSRCL